ncbi:ABC transporter ATP-binding protein [Sedimentibacter sp. MB31-C6]|uniref:ABC transporter ATP-binding protein n=1 Tax=Sedimentibacter sp. MB31-C6 TaxID=3109366 RepID=UPI002DDD20AE|nr:ABC transporter ATP-binding protein [Sedimentibacter sp. MB36-C1]WSI05200.1 ABC transporter ATP-binding protein [Sedimentibacter sp. MB36-C1]
MLTLNNVYAGYKGIDVLKNISMTVNKGENLCILGPNGCGKTTLIKAIAGLIPIKGNVQIDGINISNMKRYEIAKKIAVMSQISTIYFSYTVFETVLLGRYLHMKGKIFKEPSEKDKKYVYDCIKAVGMYKFRDRQITTLSGGQLQRVFLARTLAQEPNIILLDEPTNHLDLKYQAELIDYLKEWSKSGEHSVIGILHDINLAMRLADNILLLKNGKITAHGPTEDVISSKNLNEVYDMDVVEFMLNSLNKWKKFDTNSYLHNTQLRKIK